MARDMFSRYFDPSEEDDDANDLDELAEVDEPDEEICDDCGYLVSECECVDSDLDDDEESEEL